MTDTSLTTMRVRRILDSMDKPRRDALKKLLPKGLYNDKDMKSWPSVKYPTGLLGVLPDGEGYGLLGHIAEEMLGQPSEEIDIERLIAITKKWHQDLTDKEEAKVRKSTTTQPFLDRLLSVRQKLEAAFIGPVWYEPTISAGHVEGHPDIKSMTQVFEIKLTGQLKENWGDFLFQTFAYAALSPKCRQVNIVLPLQDFIWTYDCSAWSGRAAYLAALEEASVHNQTVVAANKVVAEDVCCRHCIGWHINRKGPFHQSIQHITDGSHAWQLFLSGNMSSRISIKEDDIVATRAHIDSTGARIFIHSPYIINLCATPGEADDYHVGCLSNCVRVAAAMGCRGVVVHVGKTTTRSTEEAMENFRINLLTAAQFATAECPILLETPAGQGTETLTGWQEFMDFVAGFADPRIRVCIDTCHVYACGHDPLEYIQKTITGHPDLLKLIHYNDSLGACGSCVDRHAYMGLGQIGMPMMTAIAEAATAAGVPCIIEY